MPDQPHRPHHSERPERPGPTHLTHGQGRSDWPASVHHAPLPYSATVHDVSLWPSSGRWIAVVALAVCAWLGLVWLQPAHASGVSWSIGVQLPGGVVNARTHAPVVVHPQPYPYAYPPQVVYPAYPVYQTYPGRPVVVLPPHSRGHRGGHVVGHAGGYPYHVMPPPPVVVYRSHPPRHPHHWHERRGGGYGGDGGNRGGRHGHDRHDGYSGGGPRGWGH